MINPQPTIEELADLFRAKSGLSEKKLSNYEQLSLFKKIDHLHNLIMMDGPRTNPGKSVIKRINDLKKELLELEEHPEMIPKMLRDVMSEKISVLIKAITPKRSRNNEMSNNEMSNNEMPNSKRTRGGRYRNKRRRTLKRSRKYKR